MLIKELAQLQLQKKLISVDRDCHDEELTGIIISANDSFVLFQEITEDGVFDGFTIFETTQIDEVYWGNREHESIAALIDKDISVVIPKLDSETFSDAVIELSKLYSNICIFKYHDEDTFSIATINSYDDDWLNISTFGPKRSLSRMEKIMKSDSISRVSVDSPYQKNIEKLHQSDL